MTTINAQDRKVFEEYTTQLGATVNIVANRLGLTKYEVRLALDHCRRAGMDVKRAIISKPGVTKPALREDVETKTIALNAGRINDELQHARITLVRITAFDKPIEAPALRLVPAVPQITAADEIRMRRLPMLKQIHRDGLRRGLFQHRSS